MPTWHIVNSRTDENRVAASLFHTADNSTKRYFHGCGIQAMLDGKDHFATERCAMEIAVAVKVFFGANGGGVRR